MIRPKPFGSDLSTKAPPVVLNVDPGGSVDPVELTLSSATNISMKFVYNSGTDNEDDRERSQ